MFDTGFKVSTDEPLIITWADKDVEDIITPSMISTSDALINTELSENRGVFEWNADFLIRGNIQISLSDSAGNVLNFQVEFNIFTSQICTTPQAMIHVFTI